MIGDRIKMLRESANMTQAALAKKLNVTRSCVNAWEIGVSTPSTRFMKELALVFDVSTDYLFDMPENNTISVDGLTDREIASIAEIIECYRNRHSDSE